MTTRPPIALSIAGTDPSGEPHPRRPQDLHGPRVLGTTAITALVAQNTHGVSRVYGIDDDFVSDQLDSVLNDMPVDATKSGMLGSRSSSNSSSHERPRASWASTPWTRSWSRRPGTASSRSMP